MTAVGAPARDPVLQAVQAYLSWSARRPDGGQVEALLAHLTEQIPFYRGMAARRLGDLPVVDRARYEERLADFQRGDSRGPYEVTTSGSTGRPLTVTLDEASWYAVNYHFFTQVCQLVSLPAEGFTPGLPGVLFASNKPARPTIVRPLPALRDSLYVGIRLGPPATVARLYTRLRAPLLYGKPTYLLDLRAALLESGLGRPPWSPQLLLTSGEPLYADDRERLRGYFGAPVVDALASTEGGLVAATRPDGDSYEVLGDNVRLEVRTGSGEVLDEGTGELVLTNLYYRDTVFARYRTGDRAELRTGADGSQRLVRLWGREPESLRFGERLLPTSVLTERLGRLRGMGDFQVAARSGGGARVRVLPDPLCSDLPGLLRDVLVTMRRLLPGCDVSVTCCHRLTPPGGKKRRYLCST